MSHFRIGVVLDVNILNSRRKRFLQRNFSDSDFAEWIGLFRDFWVHLYAEYCVKEQLYITSSSVVNLS